METHSFCSARYPRILFICLGLIGLSNATADETSPTSPEAPKTSNEESIIRAELVSLNQVIPLEDCDRITVIVDSGWSLHVFENGAGRLGYGSNLPLTLAPGAFSFSKVHASLSELHFDSEHRPSQSASVGFHKRDARSTVMLRTTDQQAIMALLLQAKDLAKHDPYFTGYYAKLWAERPPVLADPQKETETATKETP